MLHVADVVPDHPGVAIELRDKLGQPQIPLGCEQPLHQTGCLGLELGIPPGNRRGPERLQPLHEQRATPLGALASGADGVEAAARWQLYWR